LRFEIYNEKYGFCLKTKNGKDRFYFKTKKILF